MFSERLLKLNRAQRELAKAFVLAFRTNDASDKEAKEGITFNTDKDIFLINSFGCFIPIQKSAGTPEGIQDAPPAIFSNTGSSTLQKAIFRGFGEIRDDFNPLDDEEPFEEELSMDLSDEEPEETAIEESPCTLPDGYQPYCLVNTLISLYENYQIDRAELTSFVENHLQSLIESIISLPGCATKISQMIYWFTNLRENITDIITRPDTLKTILNYPGSSEILSKALPEYANDIQGKLSAESFSYHPGFLSSSLPVSWGQTGRHRPRTTSSNGSLGQNGLHRTSTPAMAISSLRMGASKFS